MYDIPFQAILNFLKEMLVEGQEELKKWLTSHLEPL